MSAYLVLRDEEALMPTSEIPSDADKIAADELLDEELDETFPASDTPSSLLREPVESPKPA